MNNLLDVRGLKTHFFTRDGIVRAADGIDLNLQEGRTLGVVGESGCGKSVTALSLLQLVDPPGRIVAGQAIWQPAETPVDLLALDPRGAALRSIRGAEIGMVFQEPLSSLSPLHTVGDQITENLLIHRPVSRQEAEARAVKMVRRVGIPDPKGCIERYPFQLSGGMRQRLMLAMALICGPRLLIADEPTTALDVTTQAQIIDLLLELQDELGMAMIFITHNLGLVAELCTEAVVMYCGKVVEHARVEDLFREPLHPYTKALLQSIPRPRMKRGGRLPSIPGSIPDPHDRPSGCPFHPRCVQRIDGTCDRLPPGAVQVSDGRQVACWLYSPEAGSRSK